MKNAYNKKKRITIIALSAAAVCLGAGLICYMATLGNSQPPTAPAEIQQTAESGITVPEIKPENTLEPSSTPQPTATFVPAPESGSAAETTTGNVQAKPSDGKPKTPAEATPPSEPPKDTAANSAPVENPDADGQCQPEQVPQPEPNQPQGGEIAPDGSIYVPGFGWLEDSGESNQTIIAPNAGTGEVVGEM